MIAILVEVGLVILLLCIRLLFASGPGYLFITLSSWKLNMKHSSWWSLTTEGGTESWRAGFKFRIKTKVSRSSSRALFRGSGLWWKVYCLFPRPAVLAPWVFRVLMTWRKEEGSGGSWLHSLFLVSVLEVTGTVVGGCQFLSHPKELACQLVMVIPCLLPVSDLEKGLCPKSGQGDKTGMLAGGFWERFLP